MIRRLSTFALAAGLALAAATALAATTAPKVCKSNETCGNGYFCEIVAPHKEGVCSKKPEMCTADYKPVCGTDGKIYSNACNAHSHGVNVAHGGICGRPAPH
jgi:hypothetical protein